MSRKPTAQARAIARVPKPAPAPLGSALNPPPNGDTLNNPRQHRADQEREAQIEPKLELSRDDVQDMKALAIELYSIDVQLRERGQSLAMLLHKAAGAYFGEYIMPKEYVIPEGDLEDIAAQDVDADHSA